MSLGARGTAAAAGSCPACGQAGRRVSGVTLGALLTPPARVRTDESEELARRDGKVGDGPRIHWLVDLPEMLRDRLEAVRLRQLERGHAAVAMPDPVDLGDARVEHGLTPPQRVGGHRPMPGARALATVQAIEIALEVALGPAHLLGAHLAAAGVGIERLSLDAEEPARFPRGNPRLHIDMIGQSNTLINVSILINVSRRRRLGA